MDEDEILALVQHWDQAQVRQSKLQAARGCQNCLVFILTSRAHTETIGWNSGLRQVCRNAQRHGCVDRSRRVAVGVRQNIVQWMATMSSLSSLPFIRIISAAWELKQILMMRARPPCDFSLLAKAQLSTLCARTSRGVFVTACDYTTFLYGDGNWPFFG